MLWIYGRRWRIEEFHKAWKLGTHVEALRPRTADNIERGAVLLAFVAIRLLQMQELVYPPTPRPSEPEAALAEQLCDLVSHDYRDGTQAGWSDSKRITV